LLPLDSLKGKDGKMNFMTTREVAETISEHHGCSVEEWQVRRLFEAGDLPAPPTFAGKRMLTPDDIPAIEAQMRMRGWLSMAVNRKRQSIRSASRSKRTAAR
jgi:hypothetical protein